MRRPFPANPEAPEAPEAPEDLERILNPVPPSINALSYRVIGAAMDVHSTLGPGFLEHVYEAALLIELSKRGLRVQQQVQVPIFYDGHQIALSRIDLVVEELLILELKAVDELKEIHKAQLLSYLNASELPLGLIINFRSRSLRAGTRRVVRAS